MDKVPNFTVSLLECGSEATKSVILILPLLLAFGLHVILLELIHHSLIFRHLVSHLVQLSF